MAHHLNSIHSSPLGCLKRERKIIHGNPYLPKQIPSATLQEMPKNAVPAIRIVFKSIKASRHQVITLKVGFFLPVLKGYS